MSQAPKLRKRIQPAAQLAAQETPAPAQPEPAQPEQPQSPTGTGSESGPKLRKRITPKSTTHSTVTAGDAEISVAVEKKGNEASSLDLSTMCGENKTVSLDTINLASMGNLEINRLASSSNSRQLRLEVEERMKKREEEYKPQSSGFKAGGFLGSIKDFAQNANIVTSNIEAKSTPFSDLIKLVDEKKIEPKQIIFRPNTSGIAGIFDQSLDELYSDIINEDTTFSLDDMQKCLNIPFLRLPAKPPQADEGDIINELITCSSNVIEKRSSSNYIFLNTKEATNTIKYSALILLNGLRVPYAKLFSRVAKIISNAVLVHPHLSILSDQVNYVASHLLPTLNEKSELRLASIVTLHMLRNCFYAPLIRFIGEQSKLKASLFYEDSLLMNTDDIFRACVVLEQVESCNIEGNLNLNQIPEYHPVAPLQFTKRVHGALKDYITAARNELMCNDERIDKRFVPKILDPVRLTFQAVLMQTDGTMAKSDYLWDLFQQICSSQTLLDNPFLPEFKRVIEERKGKLTDNSTKKLLDVIPKLLEIGILPFILPFATTVYLKNRNIANSVILANPYAITKISFYILQIGEIRYKFEENDLLGILQNPGMLKNDSVF
ncbi:hypothetical protein TVAG_437840 [Trichomonas vaginalis G3]|uniref:Uncharacterized protein n=1 Tax=Trichomonas vaginalis (strain ATCC PRA-98 / G3) TaxID=412133 RepID=A2FCE6_TRIV3|nr:hypothetical protein TVAGG3_0498150 [Trichomonas vaginalis G3]EAX97406.1 hypothetical protein TVAG_437840 [Trichomonas vaginalis G3]KAI5516873.1 hypothetical protein TVAGG3_0498150 [Trichomonas vaginalis G3]|eukprot:XP_001310336.1 hypothetical protein [Trichomonas vaginalis G3]